MAKEWNEYLTEAAQNKGKVVLTEGAKELISKAQAYVKRKEKEAKTLDAHIKGLKDMANDEYHELTADDLILPIIAGDEHHEIVSDELYERADKTFERLVSDMAAMQEIAGEMAKELEEHKAKKEEGNTVPK